MAAVAEVVEVEDAPIALGQARPAIAVATQWVQDGRQKRGARAAIAHSKLRWFDV